jgi:ABC-2 type transport system permease protein
MMRWLRALEAVVLREAIRFLRQTSRLASAVVRPALWLLVFGTGFSNVLGISITPPYQTYVTYDVYMVPGLIGMVLLFQGMQSSLALVFDREAGFLRLLLTAPVPRWFILFAKLLAGTILGVLQAYAFFAVAWLADVDYPPMGLLTAAPAIVVGGFALAAIGLLLTVYVRRMENFAGTMNFVIFPAFFLSTALFPAWKVAESGALWMVWAVWLNPFSAIVEFIRFALYGEFALRAGLLTLCVGVLAFVLAARGYDPQNGTLGRRGRDEA